MIDEDDTADRQERDADLVAEHVAYRLEPIEAAYRQALTSLWLGNGGASLAVLAFIGATWRDGKFPHQALWPFSCFVLGLISMGIGTGLYLLSGGRSVHYMERQRSWLGFRVGSAKSPTQRAGLTFKDPRTVAATISAGWFAIGCIVGLSELWWLAS